MTGDIHYPRAPSDGLINSCTVTISFIQDMQMMLPVLLLLTVFGDRYLFAAWRLPLPGKSAR
jgi:hypothetical protein